tara:strand:- start:841 stop:1191 length:351 start_codon:yes stop_codon:yes gene_type:complete
MALKQKYIEDSPEYDMDAAFLDQLRDFPIEFSVPVAVLMDSNAEWLPEENGWTQTVGGVIRKPHSFFFEIEYFHQTGEVPVFLSVRETDADTYLDHMNAGTTFFFDTDYFKKIKFS